MGSEFKGEILKEQIAQVLKQWHSEVRDRRKNRERGLIQHPPTVTATHRGANNSYSKFDPHNASTSSPYLRMRRAAKTVKLLMMRKEKPGSILLPSKPGFSHPHQNQLKNNPETWATRLIPKENCGKPRAARAYWSLNSKK